MINVEISQKMIERVKEMLDYNINIMNERGIIIASTDSNRVGTFHEIALKILGGNEDIIEIGETSDLLGVKSGINTVLFYEREKIGVLGITGEPDEVRPFVQILKFAMETMFEHEISKQRDYQQLSQNDRLLNGLIYGNNEESELIKCATELNYKTDIYRIPIHILFDDPNNYDMYFRLIKRNSYYSKQDIILKTSSKEMTVFKHFDSDKREFIFRNYRNIIEEYLSEVMQMLKVRAIEHHIYVGNFSHKLQNYHTAIRRLEWMERNSDGDSEIEYFYDYIGAYMKDQIPVKDMHEIFSFFTKEVDSDFLDNMVVIADKLNKNNYSLSSTSSDLFVHKNTLFLKISKYKDFYNINPMKNTHDRVFWEYLSYYYDCTHESNIKGK